MQGFQHAGRRIPLVSPQTGIWKPASFERPLSILTSVSGPYQDRDGLDAGTGRIRYAYRGTDPNHWDNVGLRRAMNERVPLIYFHGIEAGIYAAVYPVFIVGDDPASLFFWVQADDASAVEDAPDFSAVAEDAEARRAYITVGARRRLHQAAFRVRVIRAYRDRCALCRLRHRELLDAAHITPDIDPEGEPLISNGLALCKLHHAAFDAFFFAVDPDMVVRVHPRILDETDGPMLVVGLQQIEGQRILLPSRPEQWPNRDRLARRFDRFLQAS
jgi:putative restriction endonuclease